MKKWIYVILALIALSGIFLTISLARPSPKSEAQKRSIQSAKAVGQIRKYIDFKIQSIDPETELFKDIPGTDYWIPRDSAADDYPFAVISAHYFGTKDELSAFENTLKAEKNLTSTRYGLVDTFDIKEKKLVSEFDANRAIFNSAEYAKDGLLFVTDVTGANSPWSARLQEITQNILHARPVWHSQSLPTNILEVNGDLLQVFSRLYWMTGNEEYLDASVDIADYYLFTEPLVRPGTVIRLRDHGSEIISGLSEFYIAISHSKPHLKEQYKKPLEGLLDAVLTYGINSEGSLMSFAYIPPVHPKNTNSSLNDTWGYIVNALAAKDMEDNETRYSESISKILISISKVHNYEWEKPHLFDGYADTTEGAISLYTFSNSSALQSWIDKNMNTLWKLQDTVVSEKPNYLYGNIARTSTLYTLMKSEGLRMDPWPDGAGLGATKSEEGLHISIHLPENTSFDGALIADSHRYKDIWNLPFNYPRMNSLPERFVPQSDKVYVLKNLVSAEEIKYTGQELVQGIPLSVYESADFLLTEE